MYNDRGVNLGMDNISGRVASPALSARQNPKEEAIDFFANGMNILNTGSRGDAERRVAHSITELDNICNFVKIILKANGQERELCKRTNVKIFGERFNLIHPNPTTTEETASGISGISWKNNFFERFFCIRKKHA